MGTTRKSGRDTARVLHLNQWWPPGHRRLTLQGGRTYVCRHCRAPMRVAGSHYLPDTCPYCGVSTWDADGVCQGPSGCDAHRLSHSQTPGFCHVCGYSIWAPLPLRRPGGDEAA